MIHCYDHTSKERMVFKSASEAAKTFSISTRSVYRSIQNSWLAANQFLFDEEEISDLEIDEKKPLEYFVYDLIKNEVVSFKNFSEVDSYMITNYNLKVNHGTLCKAIERKTLCCKTFFCAKENDFSFITKHRNFKYISRKYKITF